MWIEIFLGIFCIFAILILLIKRFCYFRPEYKLLDRIANYQDIYLGNLHAWFLKSPGKRVILFCHGNAGNISHRQEKILALYNLGYSVLIFDYSGFGQSKGVPSEEMCYANSSMFVEYLLRNGYRINDIILYGESLGAPVAINTAKKYGITWIILEGGIPGIASLVEEWFPSMGTYLSLFFNDFCTDNIRNLQNTKILLLHCEKDKIVPYHHAEKLSEYCTELVPMYGTHNNPEIPWEKVGKFLG